MDCCRNVFRLCDKVPACLTFLKIKTDRTLSALKITIKDKFKNRYVIEQTADVDGIVSIRLKDNLTDPDNQILADIPYFLLNQYAGMFLIYIYDTVLLRDVVWGEFDSIVFECASVTPVEEEYIIDPNTQEGGDFNNDFSNDFN